MFFLGNFFYGKSTLHAPPWRSDNPSPIRTQDDC